MIRKEVKLMNIYENSCNCLRLRLHYCSSILSSLPFLNLCRVSRLWMNFLMDNIFVFFSSEYMKLNPHPRKVHSQNPSPEKNTLSHHWVCSVFGSKYEKLFFWSFGDNILPYELHWRYIHLFNFIGLAARLQLVRAFDKIGGESQIKFN